MKKGNYFESYFDFYTLSLFCTNRVNALNPNYNAVLASDIVSAKKEVFLICVIR